MREVNTRILVLTSRINYFVTRNQVPNFAIVASTNGYAVKDAVTKASSNGYPVKDAAMNETIIWYTVMVS